MRTGVTGWRFGLGWVSGARAESSPFACLVGVAGLFGAAACGGSDATDDADGDVTVSPGGSSNTTAGTTPDDTLSCQTADVLRTGLAEGDILDVRVRDGYFYVAGDEGVRRVPQAGGESEAVVTFAEEATDAALSPKGILAIPFSGAVNYTDYAGSGLGQWDFVYSTTTPLYDAASDQLLLVTVGDTIQYDTIDLTTQARETHAVSDPEGSWAALFADTDADDWTLRLGNASIFLEHQRDDGKISRIPLGTDIVERFVPELPEADVVGFSGGATYVWTGGDRDTEVIELYRVDQAGTQQTVSALHDETNLTLAIIPGFDGELYYRLNSTIYHVDGVDVEIIGEVEAECQRDGFLLNGGQYYALSHLTSTGTSTETVIMKLTP
jgi:hypothetical protein